MDTARRSAILERGKGSAVLEGSSAVIEGEGDTPAAVERVGEDTTANLQVASQKKIGDDEDTSHQQENGKVEEAAGVEGGVKVKQRKKKYVLKGGASAVAVQLFGMDDKFEMRSVVIHALCHWKVI